MGLTADQRALLNQATITMADLAEGYLALTNGTTITLDADAAGYGWFIDSTPFTHEEFVSLSAWELEAASGSGAENTKRVGSDLVLCIAKTAHFSTCEPL